MSFDSLLNTTATIERESSGGADDYGGKVRGWSTLLSFRCNIQPVSGEEKAAAGSQGVAITHKMFARPFPMTVTEKDRVKVGSTIYDIESIGDAAGRGHHVEVKLREVRDAGS